MSDLYDSTQCVCVCACVCVCDSCTRKSFADHAHARWQIHNARKGPPQGTPCYRQRADRVGSSQVGRGVLASVKVCVCVHARARAHDRVQARGEAPHACACVQRRGEVEVDGPCDRHRRHMKSH